METTHSNTNALEGKTIALIAYLTILGLIIAFIMNAEKKNAFAKFHIIQSFGLALTGLALWLLNYIPYLGWLINLIGVCILLYMWIMGLMNAINEKTKPVPLMGEFYIKWFNNI